ncbi:hypothetical protein [Streptomyces sp. NPDC048641]|uniref:hypothetical protein n=1 Tax=Streptomyces sp. NPDC048641 TaxID=3154825 RepID=UPI00341979D4
MGELAGVQIHFEPLDGDGVLAERAVRETYQQLSRLGVRATRPAEAAPADSKAGASELLTLAIQIAPYAGLLGGVINATVFCLKRRMMASVLIELRGDRLELRGPWSQDKQAVIDKWIEAHSDEVEEGEETD